MCSAFNTLNLGRGSYRFPFPIYHVWRSSGSAEFLHLTAKLVLQVEKLEEEISESYQLLLARQFGIEPRETVAAGA